MWELDERITPADAGKTSFVQRVSGCGWDHPRRCGENTICDLRRSAGIGSSPQVRGKHAVDSVSAISFRITPAGAGKTDG